MLKRILSLACCLSLTVGLFTYRPPEAKAIVTEASLATSVLWSFMQSAGITFNGTGMNSSSWAEAIEPYLRDFTEWKDSAAKSFWNWLGYDGASEFIKALSWSKITHPTTMPFPSVVIPPAVAKKMGEFTHWFAEKVGLASDSKPITISGTNIKETVMAGMRHYFSRADNGTANYNFISGHKHILAFYSPLDLLKREGFTYGVIYTDAELPDPVFLLFKEEGKYGRIPVDPGLYFDNRRDIFRVSLFNSDFTQYTDPPYPVGLVKLCDYSPYIETSVQVSFISVTQPGALSPIYDDKGEKPTVVAYPNINGDLSSISDLLQQILDKLAANDLNSSASLEGEAAPDVPATDIGWKGTIEKIYQGIIDLPGRIAEAIKDLFIPHEGYAAEFVSGLTGAYQGRFGLLTYPFSVLGDFVGTVATLDEQEPILRWNDVKWQDHVVIAKGEYNLKSAIAGTEMQTVYQVYRTVASAALIVGFLHLCIRKLREVQSH